MWWIPVVLAAWCLLPFPAAVTVGRLLAGRADTEPDGHR